MAEERELDLNRETVRFIIDKAHEFHVKEAVTIPEESLSPSDDWAMQVLADHGDDPSFQELHSTINDLEPDQQVLLVALMWVGRGDFTLDEWDDALERAKDAWNTRTAEYLIGTPLVADYLAEGLEQFPNAED
ncbi:MAG: DUF3775 domain-containing protein [Chromatiales bacterium]|nr:MAG: DUF3775 domain-containing protein [Chromatiales bacterium]